MYSDMLDIDNENEKYLAHTYEKIKIDVAYTDGSYIFDKQGKKYLDMYSGISVNSLGGCNEQIVYSIISQSIKYIHLSNNFYIEPAIKLAKLLVENSFAKKVFFTNSGTESNEAAIKIARKFGKNIAKDKTIILSANNSFHGRTMGSLSLTGQKKYKHNYTPLVADVEHVNFNDINDLIKKVSNRVCAIFLEFIQGEGGIVEITDEFVQTLKELSKTYNFLIVIDEIQTGIGRTGKMFAYEYFDIYPDMVTISKSLGGGLPLGAVLIGEKCENTLSIGDHGSTFAPNPVSCAAGITVLKNILEEDFLKNIVIKSKFLYDELLKIKEQNPNIIKNIRGKGMMIGVDVGHNANQIKEKAYQHKLLLNVTAKNVIRLLPPLNISTNEINEFIYIFDKIIKAI